MLDPVEGGVGEHKIELLDVVQLIDVQQDKPQVLPDLRSSRLNHTA
jgi:hypothetical protein